MHNNKKIIIWKTAHAKYSIASVRYRCFLPAMTLISFGYKSIVLQKNETIHNFDNIQVLIFVKTFTKDDLELAKKAHEHGVSIYIDLCDNIFVEHYRNKPMYCCFTQIAKLSKAIVTTGDELAALIAKHLIEPLPVLIIPDQLETQNNNLQLLKLIRQREFSQPAETIGSCKLNLLIIKDKLKSNFILFKLMKVAHLLRTRSMFASKYISKNKNIKLSYFFIKTKLSDRFINSPAKKVIWFGNAGSSFSTFGLPSLAAISNHLIAVNKITPVKLLVVSNDYQKYCELIQPLPFLTDYKQWHPHQIFDDIESADVCILPNSKDDFSICKSPNRTLLALSLRVPVVATRIPSIAKLEGCIICDEWENGLITYLTDKDRLQQDVNTADKIIDHYYSADAIAKQWNELLARNS